jgi:hypothetical protein
MNSWIIKKRYKNFEDLKNKLSKLQFNCLHKLPKKKLFNLDPKVITERKDLLEGYLNEILNMYDLSNYLDILEFIEMDVDTYNLFVNRSGNSTNHDPSTKQSTFKKSTILNSINDIKKCKSTEYLLNDTTMKLSSKFAKNDEDKNSSIQKEISDFLSKLENEPNNKSFYVKEKEESLKSSKIWHYLKKSDISRLFYGDYNNNGLLYHCGLINQNIIGAEACLEYLTKLLDYEYNVDCENYIIVLKSADLSKIKQMSLNNHIKNNKQSICFKIISLVLNKEKGITLENIIDDRCFIEKYLEWTELGIG